MGLKPSHPIRTFVLSTTVLLLLLIFSGCARGKQATEWPRWRGPNGDGVSLETDWDPQALDGTLRILWRAKVGRGYANVVLAGDRLFTTSASDRKQTVHCLNAATGEEIWRYEDKKSYYEPMATPCVNRGLVYAVMDDGLLLCLKAGNGDLKWKKELVSDCGAVAPVYGFAASPVIEGDALLLTVNTSGLALDRRSGETLWSSEPPPPKGQIDTAISVTTGTGYTTPVVFSQNGARYAIFTSYAGVQAVQPESGELQWSVPWDPYGGGQVADALVFDNKVFFTVNSGLGCFLLDMGSGKARRVWSNTSVSSDISSPVYVDGYIYACEGGPGSNYCALRCVEAESGRLMWEKDFGGKYEWRNLSFLAVEDKVIVLEDTGTLHVIEADPNGYTEIASCTLPSSVQADIWWTPPVLLDGKLFCRSKLGELICIDTRT
jgi:outer membrane protein assembly factor BamB